MNLQIVSWLIILAMWVNLFIHAALVPAGKFNKKVFWGVLGILGGLWLIVSVLRIIYIV